MTAKVSRKEKQDKRLQEVQKRIGKSEAPEKTEPPKEKENFNVEETVVTGEKDLKAPKGDSSTDNPLTSEAVIREGRNYTKPKIEGTPPDRTPVPNFTKPTIKLDEAGNLIDPDDEEENGSGNNDAGKSPANKPTGGNNIGSGNSGKSQPDVFAKSGDDDFSDKPKIINTKGSPDKDARKKAKQLAELCMWIYEATYGYISRWQQLDDHKLNKMAKRGLLDMRVLSVQVSDGRTVKAIIDEYNVKVDDICTVDEEYKQDMLKTLTDIFIEEGWGLSDKQYFFFKLLMKTITDIAQLIEQRGIIKIFLATASQQFVQQNGAGSAPTPPPATEKTEKKTAPKKEKEQPNEIVPEQVPAGTVKTKKKALKEIEEATVVPPDTVETEKVKEVVENEDFNESE